MALIICLTGRLLSARFRGQRLRAILGFNFTRIIQASRHVVRHAGFLEATNRERERSTSSNHRPARSTTSSALSILLPFSGTIHSLIAVVGLGLRRHRGAPRIRSVINGFRRLRALMCNAHSTPRSSPGRNVSLHTRRGVWDTGLWVWRASLDSTRRPRP